jgi:hypothetical protein
MSSLCGLLHPTACLLLQASVSQCAMLQHCPTPSPLPLGRMLLSSRKQPVPPSHCYPPLVSPWHCSPFTLFLLTSSNFNVS